MNKREHASMFLILNYLLKVYLCIYYRILYVTEKLLTSTAANEQRLGHSDSDQTGAERENGKGLN